MSEKSELLEKLQRDVFDIRLMLKGLKKEEWLFQRLDVFVKKYIPVSVRGKAWTELELIRKEYFDSAFIKKQKTESRSKGETKNERKGKNRAESWEKPQELGCKRVL